MSDHSLLADTLTSRSQRLRDAFSFPSLANEYATRLVASQVVLLVIAILVTKQPALLGLLIYGFFARVTTGTTFSPMAQIANRLALPLLGNPKRIVATPAKRFAQAIGLLFSVAAGLLWVGLGYPVAASLLLAALGACAALEAVAGICVGCLSFGWLSTRGLFGTPVCLECQNIRTPNRS